MAYQITHAPGYFPPIVLDEQWEYTTEIREVSRTEKQEDLASYIWRIFVACVTLRIFCEGCPERLCTRQITHEVDETFYHKGTDSFPEESVKRIIEWYFLADLYCGTGPNERLFTRIQRLANKNLQITARRTVVNWTHLETSTIFSKFGERVPASEDIPSYDSLLSEGGGLQNGVNRPNHTITLEHAGEFDAPSAEGVYKRRFERGYVPATALNSYSPAVAKCQLHAAFKRIKAVDQTEPLLQALDRLACKPGKPMLNFQGATREHLFTAAGQPQLLGVPSCSGRWTLEFDSDRKPEFTVMTYIGKLSGIPDLDDYKKNLKEWLLRTIGESPGFTPLVDFEKGVIGYTYRKPADG